MAICLPGMASRVKRAATSATRSAPLVMTTNCTMTMIMKVIRPTTRLSPMTNSAKVRMTFPALPPLPRMSVVVEMFSESRYSVSSSSTVGKLANCSGSVI